VDVVGGRLWDDGGVSQWVDQQDAGQNGVSVSQVLEDGGEDDGGLQGGDSGDEGRIIIPKGQGGTRLGG